MQDPWDVRALEVTERDGGLHWRLEGTSADFPPVNTTADTTRGGLLPDLQ